MTSRETYRGVISILVADRFGSLPRIAEIFGSRGYNVDSICSGSCEEPKCQRLTVVCTETTANLENMVKLLQDLIDVYQVKLVNHQDEISREMMLGKILLEKNTRQELLSLLKILKVEIIEIKNNTVIFEVARTAQQIDDICRKLLPYKIIEMARTGEAAIHRKTT